MGTHPIFQSDFDCLTEGTKKSRIMSDYEDDQFEQSGSGASLTYPKQCSALRKNEFVMIKGKACKIVDMSTSKPESTDTPKFTWSPSISSMVRSTKIFAHPLTTWNAQLSSVPNTNLSISMMKVFAL